MYDSVNRKLSRANLVSFSTTIRNQKRKIAEAAVNHALCFQYNVVLPAGQLFGVAQQLKPVTF